MNHINTIFRFIYRNISYCLKKKFRLPIYHVFNSFPLFEWVMLDNVAMWPYGEMAVQCGILATYYSEFTYCYRMDWGLGLGCF